MPSWNRGAAQSWLSLEASLCIHALSVVFGFVVK